VQRLSLWSEDSLLSVRTRLSVLSRQADGAILGQADCPQSALLTGVPLAIAAGVILRRGRP
jgi:hypothetical protein